jgi:DNA mismatch repair protein MutS
MLRQYQELKQQHPGTLLFFRLGDFYELFYDDAITGARELQITLTARNKEHGTPVPMCGVPHHAASGYIAKLVRKGYRVAVCEQTEEASKTKKLVRREVVRVITPGTAIDPQLIDASESVYLAALCGTASSYGAAFLELSTGDFRVTETSGPDAWARIRSDIESFAPKELLFPGSLTLLVKDAFGERVHTEPLPISGNPQGANVNAGRVAASSSLQNITLTPTDDWQWREDESSSLLCKQLGARELAGYGLEGKNQAIRAAGACLNYAHQTQRASVPHIADIHYFEAQDSLVLDAVTLRNLELVEGQSGGGRQRSLLGVIDQTVTGMGARLLRGWLMRPSIRRSEIEARLDAVGDLLAQLRRDRLRGLLKDVSDLERLVGRIHLGTATPRDMVALRGSLDQVPPIRHSLSDASSSLLQVLRESMDELPQIRELIERAICDEPAANLSDGGVIRDGYHAELDELRATSRNAKQTIASIEARERERSGINTLRVRFNNVFGYFIEVSKGAASRVPDDYERRQTLTNAERYTTPELKDWEGHVLGAEERIVELEATLFTELRAHVAKETVALQATARALATVDGLAALAETAVRRRYVRPQIHDGDVIEIKEGRHPMIEALSPEPFIPNDLYMNNSTDRFLIITGPNMGGKSSLLRQTALIQVLAQMGSFVPAKEASLPVLDRIWTRVGASDDVMSGRSTFMVEMTETAAILHNATPRSLVLLDEIGRGTSTFDGLSIAWAVSEFLHDSNAHAAKTLFATHYHELTELAERLPGARNYQITAAEREGEVIFLHRLEPGRASKSYGIEVARLAGLPPIVLDRAREVLERLERYELDVFAEEVQPGPQDNQQISSVEPVSSRDAALSIAARRAAKRHVAAQVTLFDSVNQELLDEVLNVDVETLSPDEAHAFLLNMRSRII